MEELLQIGLGLFGGLALFLYGMNLMSNNLQEAAGERMRAILAAVTKNPFFGVLAGALATAVLQSSSATTVMTIGFVAAGLMGLRQAIPIIMGANIGTTITAQIIAFKLSDYVLGIVLVGFLVMQLAKQGQMKYVGTAVFGFGLLFLGIDTMGAVMKPLAENPVFTDMIAQVTGVPVLGVLVGTLMTLVVQSSSATIAVLQNFAATPGADKPARSASALARNEELARAEKMRREFTANVSHEMKTPLQVISGYAELMANGLVPPEDVPRFAQLIYEESQAMRALIDDVLILSRLDEMAPGADEAEAVDLRAVAERVVGRLTKLAADADVEVHLKAEPVTVQGNETLLKQMIYNLVENAIRYNREGGHVLVEVCEEDVPAGEGPSGEGGVRIGIIRVNDTGAGIPADKLEKIFERFYRLEKSRSKELGGTGLGLAIVKHAALYHGGEVFVESEEDVGTRFTVRLPIG